METQVHVSRWQQRNERRLENARLAEEAAARRAERNTKSLTERVEAGKKRLAEVNVAGAIQLIGEANLAEYDILLLAEKYGQARVSVLKQFGAPRGTVERQYRDEVGLGNPEQSGE